MKIKFGEGEEERKEGRREEKGMAQNSLPPWSFHSSQGLQGQESRAAEVRTGGLRGCLEGVALEKHMEDAHRGRQRLGSLPT